MKTPITYYGGKQQLASRIIQLFPEHTTYTESFVGGGAIFWKKEPSEVEVINDTNGAVVNFYEVLKTDYQRLKRLIQMTPLSRRRYEEASVIYRVPRLFTPISTAGSSAKSGSPYQQVTTEPPSKKGPKPR